MRTRKTLGGGLSIGEAADANAYVLESDSFAVTGGQFGIEASVISLAGYCIVAAIAYAQLRADNAKRSQPKPDNKRRAVRDGQPAALSILI